MRIAIVGPIPPPNGGMAMQTKQLIRLMDEAGFDVTHIATNGAYRPAVIGRIPVVRALFRLCGYLFTLLRSLKSFDVIHLMANSGWSFYLFVMPVIYIASWYKVPVVMNYRGGLADEFFAKDWRWIKGAITRVKKVIVPSDFLKQIFEKYDVVTTIVPNIVDLTIFDVHQPALNDDSLHVVVTRNLELIYDNKTAIEGFALFSKQYPNATMSIAGTGEQRSELEHQVASLDLNERIHFLGRLERNEMAKLYSSADILLNTSLVDNTPNSIIEALACGLVVVSSDVGGIPCLVSDNKHAFLIPPSAPQRVADKLIEVLLNKKTAQEIALNGHNMVTRFTPEVVIPQLITIYQGLR